MASPLDDVLIQGRYLKEWVKIIPGYSAEQLYRISSEGGSLARMHCDLIASNEE